MAKNSKNFAWNFFKVGQEIIPQVLLKCFLFIFLEIVNFAQLSHF
jgi:hypothetical protein